MSKPAAAEVKPVTFNNVLEAVEANNDSFFLDNPRVLEVLKPTDKQFEQLVLKAISVGNIEFLERNQERLKNFSDKKLGEFFKKGAAQDQVAIPRFFLGLVEKNENRFWSMVVGEKLAGWAAHNNYPRVLSMIFAQAPNQELLAMMNPPQGKNIILTNACVNKNLEIADIALRFMPRENRIIAARSHGALEYENLQMMELLFSYFPTEQMGLALDFQIAELRRIGQGEKAQQIADRKDGFIAVARSNQEIIERTGLGIFDVMKIRSLIIRSAPYVKLATITDDFMPKGIGQISQSYNSEEFNKVMLDQEWIQQRGFKTTASQIPFLVTEALALIATDPAKMKNLFALATIFETRDEQGQKVVVEEDPKNNVEPDAPQAAPPPALPPAVAVPVAAAGVAPVAGAAPAPAAPVQPPKKVEIKGPVKITDVSMQEMMFVARLNVDILQAYQITKERQMGIKNVGTKNEVNAVRNLQDVKAGFIPPNQPQPRPIGPNEGSAAAIAPDVPAKPDVAPEPLAAAPAIKSDKTPQKSAN